MNRHHKNSVNETPFPSSSESAADDNENNNLVPATANGNDNLSNNPVKNWTSRFSFPLFQHQDAKEITSEESGLPVDRNEPSSSVTFDVSTNSQGTHSLEQRLLQMEQELARAKLEIASLKSSFQLLELDNQELLRQCQASQNNNAPNRGENDEDTFSSHAEADGEAEAEAVARMPSYPSCASGIRFMQSLASDLTISSGVNGGEELNGNNHQYNDDNPGVNVRRSASRSNTRELLDMLLNADDDDDTTDASEAGFNAIVVAADVAATGRSGTSCRPSRNNRAQHAETSLLRRSLELRRPAPRHRQRGDVMRSSMPASLRNEEWLLDSQDIDMLQPVDSISLYLNKMRRNSDE